MELKKIFLTKRDSNLELLRIVAMLGIIASHYGFGLKPLLAEEPLSINSLWFLNLTLWGKVGINCFMLISGYFMCEMAISAKKYIKLLAQVYFYSILINGIFLLSGYCPIRILDYYRRIYHTNSTEIY